MFDKSYSRCWLPNILSDHWTNKVLKCKIFSKIYFTKYLKLIILKQEITFFIKKIISIDFVKNKKIATLLFIYDKFLFEQEYLFIYKNKSVFIYASKEIGLIYGFYYLLKNIQLGFLRKKKFFIIREKPLINIRMLTHWDNLDGSIEKGYSGNSIFFFKNNIHYDLKRIKDYSRLLVSIGINYVCLNNPNVNLNSTYLITKRFLIQLIEIYNILNNFNIKIVISVNYKSFYILNNIFNDHSSDNIKLWWFNKIKEIYEYMPNFGGFIVKIDTTRKLNFLIYRKKYIKILKFISKPLDYFGGLLFLSCFVLNKQNWRNKKIDISYLIYENFYYLNNLLPKNIILQIKNGPFGYQVREPVSPLLGMMDNTSQMLEIQITQEYTGQQIDICWLAPQ